MLKTPKVGDVVWGMLGKGVVKLRVATARNKLVRERVHIHNGHVFVEVADDKWRNCWARLNCVWRTERQALKAFVALRTRERDALADLIEAAAVRLAELESGKDRP